MQRDEVRALAADNRGAKGLDMILSLDAWLLPAIAASSSSYLVSLCWERLRRDTAPGGLMAGFLAALSFIMGGISAYYRHSHYAASPENNIIVMFIVGASTTFLWLRFRNWFFRSGKQGS